MRLHQNCYIFSTGKYHNTYMYAEHSHIRCIYLYLSINCLHKLILSLLCCMMVQLYHQIVRILVIEVWHYVAWNSFEKKKLSFNTISVMQQTPPHKTFKKWLKKTTCQWMCKIFFGKLWQLNQRVKFNNRKRVV